MWVGIILIVMPLLYNVFFVDLYFDVKYVVHKLCFWAIVVVLITGGLIYTFKNKDGGKNKAD